MERSWADGDRQIASFGDRFMTSRFVDPSEIQRLRSFDFRFPSGSLKDKVILVPGGTGGLGVALVAYLLLEQAIPVVGYRSNAQRANVVKEKLESRYGGTVHFVKGDLRVAADRRSYVEAAARPTGAIQGLASFVGDPARAKFEDLTAEDLVESYQTNFVAPILLAKAVAEHMIARAIAGSLVLLSSMQGVGLFEKSLAYAAPKSSLIHACRILAKQWSGPANLRINIVAPGATIAGMAEASVGSGKYDSYVDTGAVARFGKPEDVARTVRFLLEPDNYITGQVLVVDGGLSLKA
jgi:NAD(P)-dependent dehydrogenase (short-subunit alcohol dehydrogenase family)